MSAGHTLKPWAYGIRHDGSMWLSLGDPKTGPHYQGDLVATPDDAALIVSAPDILAERDRLKALNAELAAVLETIVRDADGRRISGNLILDENSPVIIAARAVLAEQKGEAS